MENFPSGTLSKVCVFYDGRSVELIVVNTGTYQSLSDMRNWVYVLERKWEKEENEEGMDWEREREIHVGASKLPRGSMTAAVNQSSDRDWQRMTWMCKSHTDTHIKKRRKKTTSHSSLLETHILIHARSEFYESCTLSPTVLKVSLHTHCHCNVLLLISFDGLFIVPIGTEDRNKLVQVLGWPV